MDIDSVVAKLRRLPPERQHLIAAAIEEMASGPYELSPEEFAVLGPALAEAKAGLALRDAETDEILNNPWT